MNVQFSNLQTIFVINSKLPGNLFEIKQGYTVVEIPSVFSAVHGA